ncbi:MAG: SAM-dependent methyltransferase [Actinomycetota bacterium]|nr:SAM-dependent methyltransferase [Actinomycetota bacterium]
MEPPSPWIVRFAPLLPEGPVLDVAAGAGRHTRYFLDLGFDVLAVDRDLSGMQDLKGHPRLEVLEADLEDGRPFPLKGRMFAAVVVTRYLYRPILPDLVSAVGRGGVLLYETFAAGNERFGKPRNPDFLLKPGELLDAVRGRLRVLAYEDLVVDHPAPAAIQRIAALNEGATLTRGAGSDPGSRLSPS